MASRKHQLTAAPAGVQQGDPGSGTSAAVGVVDQGSRKMPATAPVAQGNLASRLSSPESATRGIRTVRYDLRMFTMWKLVTRAYQTHVAGEWYAVSRLPVSRRHNDAEGVFTDRMTNSLVHLPTHWARKGWKLHDCADDLRPWCADQSVFPNGFEPLPVDYQTTNAKTAQALSSLMDEHSPSAESRNRKQQLEDLSAILVAACGGRAPVLKGDGQPFTANSAQALADAAASLPDDERAKLAQILGGGKDGT